MSRDRAVDLRKDESQEPSPVLSEVARAFVRTYVLEEVQRLARNLLWEGGSVESREQAVKATYDRVTGALVRFPTDRNDDVTFLANVVEELFKLEPSDSNEYEAEDIFCSDIGDVLSRNGNNGSDIKFIHNVLSTIQRIGVLANLTGEGSDKKNVDANEEFLTLSPEELEPMLRDSQREFFHRQ